jgi:hypothetical protein
MFSAGPPFFKTIVDSDGLDGPVTFFLFTFCSHKISSWWPLSPPTARPLLTNSVLAEHQRWRQPAASAQAAVSDTEIVKSEGLYGVHVCVCRECMGDRDIATHQGEGRRHGKQACPPLLRTPPLRRARVVNMGSVVSVRHILCGCFCGQCDGHANTLAWLSPTVLWRRQTTDRQTGVRNRALQHHVVTSGALSARATLTTLVAIKVSCW